MLINENIYSRFMSNFERINPKTKNLLILNEIFISFKIWFKTELLIQFH